VKKRVILLGHVGSSLIHGNVATKDFTEKSDNPLIFQFCSFFMNFFGKNLLKAKLDKA
jgi:hypothetical protein